MPEAPQLTKKQLSELSEFFKYSRPKKKPCSLGYALAKLGDPDADQLAGALKVSKEHIPSGAIIEWLTVRKQEQGVTHSAITNHRAGTCSCYDE